MSGADSPSDAVGDISASVEDRDESDDVPVDHPSHPSHPVTERGISNTEREYIQILPVRDDVKLGLVETELFGMSRDPHTGTFGRLKQRLRGYTDRLKLPQIYEFIIYKPKNKGRFEFYMGVEDSHPEASFENLEAKVASQYPADFQFEHSTFDISGTFDETPQIVKWNGVEERRGDWMTQLNVLEGDVLDRSPLSEMLQTVIQKDEEFILQVLFQPRHDWSSKAERKKNSVIGDAILELLNMEPDDSSQREDRELGASAPGTEMAESRAQQIDRKDPSHTFNVSIRAACESAHLADRLKHTLDPFDGEYYRIKGTKLGQDEEVWERMLKREITYPKGFHTLRKIKPTLVMGTEELLGIVTVPSLDALPKAARSGSGGTPSSQSPLTSPKEEFYDAFDDGMTIGRVPTGRSDNNKPDIVTELDGLETQDQWRDAVNYRETLSLSAGDLKHHYLRAGTTGSGKTVATVNDMLTAYDNLDGPVILVDPKDGDMCENYLRSHRAVFGDLDDVEYIRIPGENGEVPGIPFFDIRPLTRGADRARETAIQDVIDHFFQVLAQEMGREKLEQAEVANKILMNLIKAKFDEEYGSDYFSIGELMETAQRYQEDQVAPKTTDPQIQSMLEGHFNKSDRDFNRSASAVLNRLKDLKGRDFIWDMLSFTVPEEQWDDDLDWYNRDEIPILDLRAVLNSNKVLIIDTGHLRQESGSIFSQVFLSHLWTSIQSLWTPNSDDYIANVIIEESAPIARSEIVYDGFLPRGREFNVCLGLIMQYPQQVVPDGTYPSSSTAYHEILNNVNTKMIANIKSDEKLADSLFHEDLSTEELQERIKGLRRGEWIVQLPATGFGGERPEVLTLRPLPIPPGHSASGFSVPSRQDELEEKSRKRYCVDKSSPWLDTESAILARGEGEAREEPQRTDGSRGSDDSELTWKQRAFIDNVFDALTDGLDTYNLSQPMSQLPKAKVADDLVEMDYLEPHTFGRNKRYYEPTEKAKEAMERTLAPSTGGERGGEGFAHTFGRRLAVSYYEQQGYDVTPYHTPPKKDVTYDVYAEPTDESPRDRAQVIEIEPSPDKRDHVQNDYQKLALEDADAIWIVPNHDDLQTLFRSLDGWVDPPSKDVQNFEEISDAIEDEGMHDILGYTTLMDAIRRD
jgi:hypothetical protein